MSPIDRAGPTEVPGDLVSVELKFDANDFAREPGGTSVVVDDDPLAGPSNLDEPRDTGETGRTGETLFVAQGAFARPDASVVREALSDDDELLPARTDTRRIWVRGLPVLLLLGVIALSAFKIAEIDSRPVAAGSAAEAEEDSPAATGEPLTESASAPVEEVELPPLPARGVPVQAILDHEVEWVQPDRESLSFTRMGEGVIEPQRVTVLNLWATYCKPCKVELPDLKAMFKRAEWGDHVRFASILSQDTKSPKTAYRDFAPKMPSADYFLAEMSSGDTSITDALRKKGLMDDGGLPITIVLDCRRDVRFAHQGRLSPRNFEELRGMIDTLVAELGGEFCEKRKPILRRPRSAESTPLPEFRPLTDPEPGVEEVQVESTPSVDPFDESTRAAAVAKPKSECGDQLCAQGIESCYSCPADCGCPGNNECKKNSSGSYACVLAASALKD